MTKESAIQGCIKRALSSLNIWGYHVPDDRFASAEGVRPDLIGISPDQGCPLIEVKKFYPKSTKPQNFRLSMISKGQRDMLDYRHSAYCGMVEHPHAYFAIGKQFVPAGKSYNGFRQPVRIWVLPWVAWVKLERTFCDDTNCYVDVAQVDQFFPDHFELIQESSRMDGKWSFHEYHPIQELRSVGPSIAYSERKMWEISYRNEEK